MRIKTPLNGFCDAQTQREANPLAFAGGFLLDASRRILFPSFAEMQKKKRGHGRKWQRKQLRGGTPIYAARHKGIKSRSSKQSRFAIRADELKFRPRIRRTTISSCLPFNPKSDGLSGDQAYLSGGGRTGLGQGQITRNTGDSHTSKVAKSAVDYSNEGRGDE
ncbi:hypothetical protein EYF80_019758 [Liparis tanakae]|uniref:Uncharacterized protein n=1 Tax=Liparis tanakae TaxID=230148 RepID=A0A4Z2HYR9_9TELE|nr:hypothetical protein EYF80_019758 [Liparis tanakae]